MKNTKKIKNVSLIVASLLGASYVSQTAFASSSPVPQKENGEKENPYFMRLTNGNKEPIHFENIYLIVDFQMNRFSFVDQNGNPIYFPVKSEQEIKALKTFAKECGDHCFMLSSSFFNYLVSDEVYASIRDFIQKKWSKKAKGKGEFIKGMINYKLQDIYKCLNYCKKDNYRAVIVIEDRNPGKSSKNPKALILDAKNGRLLTTSSHRKERQKTQDSIAAEPKNRKIPLFSGNTSSGKEAYVNKVPHEIFEKLTKENKNASEKNFFFMNAENEKHLLILDSKGNSNNTIFQDMEEQKVMFAQLKSKRYILPHILLENLYKTSDIMGKFVRFLSKNYSNDEWVKNKRRKALKKSRKNGWFSRTDKTIALQNRDDPQYTYILDIAKKQYEKRRTQKVLSNEFNDYYRIRVPTQLFEMLLKGFRKVEASAPKPSMSSKIKKNMNAFISSPITEAVIVAATADALIYYTGNLDGVINAGTNVLDAMKGKAMDTLSALKDVRSNALSSISGYLGGFFGKGAAQSSGSDVTRFWNDYASNFGNHTQNATSALKSAGSALMEYEGNMAPNLASAKSRYFSDLAKCLSYAEVKLAKCLSDVTKNLENLKSAFSYCGEKVVFAPSEAPGAATAKNWDDCVIKHLPNLGANEIKALRINAMRLYDFFAFKGHQKFSLKEGEIFSIETNKCNCMFQVPKGPIAAVEDFLTETGSKILEKFTSIIEEFWDIYSDDVPSSIHAGSGEFGNVLTKWECHAK